MNDCCQVEANLGAPERLSDDLSVKTCSVCGAKHYELELETADLVSEGADV